MRAGCTIVLALLVVLTTRGAQADDYRVDPDGRRYRVDFDPAARVWLGSGYAPRAATSIRDEPARGYVELGLAYRHRWSFPEEGVAWKLEHDLLPTRLLFGPPALAWSSTLYRGRFVRWSRDGRIFIPPDSRVPFPLDVGFETELGHVDYRELTPGFAIDLEAVRSEIVLGLLRRESLRSWVRVGVGPSYGLRLVGIDDDPLAIGHRIAPFSAGSFAAHHESADGHHAVEAGVRGSYALRVDHGWAFEARAHVSYELVLIAINDLPASSYIDASYTFRGDPPTDLGRHEVVASAGLRFSVPLTGGE
ncbi:MAG: hypothetical protein KC731_16760 [Myxococcales bacterium]|nr:hypothetical protein [Myxococcales bacterium]